MYTEEGCQHCRWARDEMGWNYCPECGLPTDPLKAFKNVSPPSEASEQKGELPQIIRFLLGECEFNGVSFGDMPPKWEEGRFWWRPYLRKYIEGKLTRPSVVTQSEKGETAEEEKIMEIINRSYNKRSLINQFQPIELEIIHEAMQEYSLLERSRAIEEVSKAVIRLAGIKYHDFPGAQDILGEVLEELEKLNHKKVGH